MELDSLLAPVSGDDPCGEDLSFSVEFDEIQEARRADDPSLDQGEWITDLKSADFAEVARRCEALLASRSKDLRLAVWLCEARSFEHGFPGLASGLRVLAGLVDRYWDGVHPVSEDDDHDQRVGNLSWLLSNAAQWAREVPLVKSSQGRYGLASFEAARSRAVQAERDGETAPDDPPRYPSLESLEKLRRETPYEFYLALARDLPDCLAALGELERGVDARLGADGPSFSATRDALERVQAGAARFVAEAGVRVDGSEVPVQSTESSDVADAGVPAAPAAVARSTGAIADRREAIAQLRRVAEFFRRTEPHSPVAYLAAKAARWGDMPLHVWLQSVVKDEAALGQLNEMLDVGAGD